MWTYAAPLADMRFALAVMEEAGKFATHVRRRPGPA
jgi:hypothetical protein